MPLPQPADSGSRLWPLLAERRSLDWALRVLFWPAWPCVGSLGMVIKSLLSLALVFPFLHREVWVDVSWLHSSLWSAFKFSQLLGLSSRDPNTAEEGPGPQLPLNGPLVRLVGTLLTNSNSGELGRNEESWVLLEPTLIRL